jgi:rhodanese-related sulfurtransferase
MKQLASTALAIGIGVVFGGVVQAEDAGNRYNLGPRLYHSEVSAAKAYLLTSHDKGHSAKSKDDEFANAVIVDVRRVSEHVASHPPGAYSIPFPHINGNPGAAGYIGYDICDPATTGPVDKQGYVGVCFGATADGDLPIDDFVRFVMAKLPDRHTPILTLCATGYRSVQAANVLTLAGYTKVRNIWEGFNGQYKYAYSGGSVASPPVQLDLDNDRVTANDNDDKDGWQYFQELPTTDKLHPHRIFTPYAYLYDVSPKK